MPVLVCEKCNVYYEIHSKGEIVELGSCECGNPLKYYDSLEEYMERKTGTDTETDFDILINSYETLVSRIIIYCVNELPFPLGINKTIEILRGLKTSLILNYNLYELNSYSALPNFSKKRLERYINKLIEQRFFEIKRVSKYNKPIISLTSKGSNFLWSDDNLKINIYGKKAVDHMHDADLGLYEILRKLRNKIAQERNVSAFIVCANDPLFQMARKKPTDYNSMIKIKGIGKNFMENYGDQFLKTIRDFKRF